MQCASQMGNGISPGSAGSAGRNHWACNLSEHPCGQRSDSRSVTVAAATDGHEERQPRGSKRALG